MFGKINFRPYPLCFRTNLFILTKCFCVYLTTFSLQRSLNGMECEDGCECWILKYVEVTCSSVFRVLTSAFA